MRTAGIIGATGYAGAELVRLLSTHSAVDRVVLSSTSFEGSFIEEHYPNLLGRVSAALLSAEEVASSADVVFSALPHGVGEGFAAACDARGALFVDLSADFRFGEDEATFAAWYGKGYAHPELHAKAVYGLPELNRASIAGAKLIANPGCYPTAASLSLYPALKLGLVGGGTVIVDAASGVTGAGRSPTQATHYPDCSDALAPYKVGGHRHVPEIARNLELMAGRPVPLVFTPHLAPMNRGILSTAYAPLATPAPGGAVGAPRPATGAVEELARSIRDSYAAFYKDEPFVRVLPFGAAATTRNVRQSNYCDLSIHLDQSGSTLIAVAAIDNMVKGAAGQAVQNMNIALGLPEASGVDALPAAF